MTRIKKMEMIVKESENIDLKDIKSLKKLSNNLFEFSDNEAQSKPLRKISINFYEIINNIVEELQYGIDNNKNIDLTEELREYDRCKQDFKSSLSYFKNIEKRKNTKIQS